ncbi:hypothetical protein CGMCC3_g7300 [Colletotrichum fructicola]|nr:uncharacterized protein CGMCC3_g7300 [Colletotrichum fructicola]KAE9576797.1 hypothetical protein CGMCC3_g7300 [Colletotrichum fructicola]
MDYRQNDFEIQVAADEQPDTFRSDIGSTIASSTISLRASLRDFLRENGRTYHRYKEGKYHLPNDERENDRTDMVHAMWLLTLNDRLGLAPPCNSDPKRSILSPSYKVYGNDLSPIQPDSVPFNKCYDNLEPGGYLELQETDLFPTYIHAYWPVYFVVGRKPLRG